MSEEASKRFLESALKEKLQRRKKQSNRLPKTSEWKYISDKEYYRLIAEWEYYAVLNVLSLETCESTPEEISHHLGVSINKSQTILNDLLSWGLVEETKDEKLVRTENKNMHSTNEFPSKALRECHKDELKLASKAIDTVSMDKRGFYSGTIATNQKAVKKAKKMTFEFIKKITDVLETGPKEEVYLISSQLFPLSKKHYGEPNE